MDALAFLKTCDSGTGIVSTNMLSPEEIQEAREAGRLFVDDDSGLGWTLEEIERPSSLIPH